MKEENVRELLETRGYSDIGDFTLDGRSFQVEAKR